MDHVNLFVIGVNKAGTSWLYKLLNGHPDIFMCAEKELFYFGEQYPDQLADYHAHFPFEQSYLYFGEATAAYCRREKAAAQIHDYAPDARVFAIVRDPIDRLHSHFNYHKQLDLVPEDASPADLMGPVAASLRENSHYENMLPAFAHLFGREQFKVVSLEEGVSDLPAFWESLQTFLDVPPAPLPESGGRSSNATGGRGFRWLYRSTIRPLKRYAPALYRALLRNEYASMAKHKLLQVLGTAEKKPIPEPVKRQLIADFQPTYRYLKKLGFTYYDDNLL